MVGQGHVKIIYKHHKREPGLFTIELQEHFAFRPGWYREPAVRDLVLEYYFVLRSVLNAKPRLRPFLTRCPHCGILFPTHPRNRGRRDVGCPFGCRQAHARTCSTERSTAYNRTPTGRRKKKARNGKRSTCWQEPVCAPEAEEQGMDPASEAPSAGLAAKDDHGTPRAEESITAEPQQESVHPAPPDTSMPCEEQKETMSRGTEPHETEQRGEEKRIGAEAHETAFDPAMVAYLRMVISRIEGRAIGRPEIVQMLNRCMRQRSMGHPRRRDYVINYLAEHPP